MLWLGVLHSPSTIDQVGSVSTTPYSWIQLRFDVFPHPSDVEAFFNDPLVGKRQDRGQVMGRLAAEVLG